MTNLTGHISRTCDDEAEGRIVPEGAQVEVVQLIITIHNIHFSTVICCTRCSNDKIIVSVAVHVSCCAKRGAHEVLR